MFDQLLDQLKTRNGVTEQLKATDQRRWVRRMNAVRHEAAEISDGFNELEEFLCNLPLEENNAVFNLCCRLCSAYEHKAFINNK